MFINIILLFTILPALELMLLIKVGSAIGIGNTFLIIVLTGIAGATLARVQGFSVWRNIQASLNRGEVPTEEMLNGLMIFCGGIVLLTPGLLTDTFGFLLLIPVTRNLIKLYVKNKMVQINSQGTIIRSNSSSKYTRFDFDDAEFH